MLLIITGGSLIFALFFHSLNPGIVSPRNDSASIEEKGFWISSDEEGFQIARLEGKPVVMDFYADWCSACKELDEKSWSDERVVAEISNFIPIKLDLTRNNEVTESYRNRYQIVGIPTVIFFSSSGEEIGRFGGFKSPEELLDYLQKYQMSS
jgi:thiol:disulfide interchange protein DsbD